MSVARREEVTELGVEVVLVVLSGQVIEVQVEGEIHL